MPQRPDFSERSLSGQAACGRHPTNGKEAGSVRRLILSFGFSDKFMRVIGVISAFPAYNDVINHDFWFSDVRYQFSDHASISRGTPYADY